MSKTPESSHLVYLVRSLQAHVVALQKQVLSLEKRIYTNFLTIDQRVAALEPRTFLTINNPPPSEERAQTERSPEAASILTRTPDVIANLTRRVHILTAERDDARRVAADRQCELVKVASMGTVSEVETWQRTTPYRASVYP